ncbi:MAG TPA: aminodeoxychorismate synthase component I [Terracidiphilus sp.]|jgi:para-aminobenzoate synthetase/4-amino-4-deoxychorismate lyase
MKSRHSLPVEIYALVDSTPATVLLEDGRSASHHNQRSHEPWTSLFTAPLRVCAAYVPEEMPALFAAIEDAVRAGLSAAGFFSYECGEAFEAKAHMRKSPGAALAWFGIYESGYRFDHGTGCFIDGEPPGLEELRAGQERDPAQPDADAGIGIAAAFGISQEEYVRRIEAIHGWIRAGDVYQLNFTAPWQVKIHGSAAALYERLRARQPVRYGAFLHWAEGRKILSFSPELFFRIDPEEGGRRIVTRPMKGTAPRGRTTREDRQRAEWLRGNAKNRSENVMIVDLLRNDLGRIANFGTVRTEDLFAVERYPTLWQMTSTVTAALREGVGFESIFRALFPCGSITGAPKVRAMQLIGEIEDGPRGVYTGAIGFFSPQESVFNVAIRTLELNSETAKMGTGSGIVIDSDAAEEYRECLLKAEFLTRIPAEFSLVETMLWKDGFPLLGLHLDRLIDSAEYFDFPCERNRLRAALVEHARGFAAGVSRKVRLLLNREGELAITDELLAAGTPAERIGRVSIAGACTDPADPMLFHKTTHRPFYREAFDEAARSGFDDVLFFNLRGELTEGAISNVFLEKNGRWLTPPIECGVLAGVYRRSLLETRPGAEERVLHEDDLRNADAVYLCNAVRGVRRVSVEWRKS